jgi:hypothetical protein
MQASQLGLYADDCGYKACKHACACHVILVFICAVRSRIYICTVDQLLASEKFFGPWPRPISTFVCGFVQAKLKLL